MKKILVFALLIVNVIGVYAQSVSSSGSLVHSIPIEVPEGTAGMQPSLALTYSSSGGNGMLGLGWGLSGIPVIARDRAFGINFNSSDHYTYNGQQLIKGAGGLYHTENESFLKIFPVNLNSEDSFWCIRRLDGVSFYFGKQTGYHDSTNYGHLEPVDKGGKALSWSLSMVEDAEGNKYIIKYTEDSIHGCIYPNRIIYTINSGMSLYKTVWFHYDEERPDSFIKYLPTPVYLRKRMTGVEVRINTNIKGDNGNLVRKYNIAYDNSDLVGTSRITSVQVVGSDGTSTLPEQSFEWENGGYGKCGFGQNNAYETGGYRSTTRYIPIDANADGKKDLVELWINNGRYEAVLWTYDTNNFKYVKSSKSDLGEYNQGSSDNENRSMDVNGDGREDIVRFYKRDGKYVSAKIYFSGKEGFTAGNSFSLSNQGYDRNVYCADINGDSRDDFLEYYKVDSTHFYVNVWCSDGATFKKVDTIRILDSNNYDIVIYPIDVNGDGINDIVAKYRGSSGNKYAKVWLYDNGQYVYKSKTTIGNDLLYHYPMDVNGDGRTDIIQISRSKDKKHYKVLTWYSDGDSFVKNDTYGFCGLGDLYYVVKFFPADLNGDGKTDLIKLFDEGDHYSTETWLSTGKGFVLGKKSYVGDSRSGLKTFHKVFDANGDGIQDVVEFYNTSSEWRTSVRIGYGPKLPLIEEFHNGYGVHAWVKYKTASEMDGVGKEEHTYPVMPNKSHKPLVYSILSSGTLFGKYYNRYDYYDPTVYAGGPLDRTNLGFRWTKKINPDGSYVSNHFINYSGNSTYDCKVFHHLPIVTAFRDKNSRVLSKINRTFINSLPKGVPSGVKNPKIKTVYNRHYNGTGLWDNPGPYKETKITYRTYDDHGNVTEIYNYGDMSTNEDDVLTRVSYLFDEDSFFSAPYEVKEYSCSLDYNSGGNALGDELALAVNPLCLMSRHVKMYYGSGDTPSGIGSLGQTDYGIQLRRISTRNTTDNSWMTSTIGYDNYGNMTWSDAPGFVPPQSGDHSVMYEYDNDYHCYPESVTSPEKAGVSEDFVTSFNYNNLGLIETVMNENNSTESKVKYDSFGRAVKTFIPDLNNTSRQASQTTYYDTASVFTVKQQALDENGSAAMEQYIYYDGLGRPVQTKTQADENGSKSWRTIDYFYDQYGRAGGTSVPYFTDYSSYSAADTSQASSHFEYDSFGRVVKQYAPDGTYSETIYKYNEILNIDPMRHVTRMTGSGNTSVVQNFTGLYPNHDQYSQTTTKAFADGVQIIDNNGNIIETRINSLGQKLSYCDPDMGLWTYDYNPDGTLDTQTDANGNITSFDYDDIGRLVNQTAESPAGSSETVSYTYGPASAADNSAGMLTSVTYPDGRDDFIYNNRGQQTSVTRTLQGKSREMQYNYNFSGQLTSATYPDGKIIGYEYQDDGALEQMGFSNGYNITDMLARNFNYTASGKTTGFTYGNGSVTSYDYYDTFAEIDAGSGLAFSNHIKNISVSNGVNISIDYEYDAVGNVKKKSGTLPNGGTEETFVYDDFYRLTGYKTDVDVVDIEETWEYDQINNITSRTRQRGVTNETFNYVYGTDKPHAVSSITGDKSFEYEYDNNGNTTGIEKALSISQSNLSSMTKTTFYTSLFMLPGAASEGQDPEEEDLEELYLDRSGINRDLEYDALNRLINITYSDGYEENYAYHPSGQRVIKTTESPDGSETTTYYFFTEYEETVSSMSPHFTDTGEGDNEVVVEDNIVRNPRRVWPAGAASVQYISGDGGVEFEAVEANRWLMFGLSDSNTDEHYNTIDYAIYLRAAYGFRIYENGYNRGDYGTYTAGDTFNIERVGNKIYYKHNGVTVRETTAVSGSLIVDMSITSDHGKVKVNRIYNTGGTEYTDIDFTDLVNVTETSANVIEKTGMMAWTLGAASMEKIYGDGGVVIEVTETNKSRMCGLSDENTNERFSSIDYAFHMNGNGMLRIYENGSNKGEFSAYQTGDLLVIERSGDTIYYKQNGTTLREVAAIEGDLLVDMSFATGGGTIKVNEIYDSHSTNYYFGNGTRVAQEKGRQGLLYYHSDHLGSSVMMTDENADIVMQAAYSAYGEILVHENEGSTSYLFTGQEYDGGSGLYYYGARYYDPMLCKFTQADTILDGLNRYAYCGNNPVNYVDPSGHMIINHNMSQIFARRPNPPQYSPSSEPQIEKKRTNAIQVDFNNRFSDRFSYIESGIGGERFYLTPLPDKRMIDPRTITGDDYVKMPMSPLSFWMRYMTKYRMKYYSQGGDLGRMNNNLSATWCTSFFEMIISRYFKSVYSKIYQLGKGCANTIFKNFQETDALVPLDIHTLDDVAAMQKLADEGYLIILSYQDDIGHIGFVGPSNLRLNCIYNNGKKPYGMGLKGDQLPAKYRLVIVNAGTYTGFISIANAVNGWINADKRKVLLGKNLRFYIVRKQ